VVRESCKVLITFLVVVIPACSSEGQRRHTGESCTNADDCDTGLVCGESNGACFGRVRAERMCWSPTCEDRDNRGPCGEPGAACGSNCACVTRCDPNDPHTVCPTGEVCEAGLGVLFPDAVFNDVCVDPRCPSNDPALCGSAWALCGAHCVCTPDCSSATCAKPRDTCGGLCIGVCQAGETGCIESVNCQPGYVCIPDASGRSTCVRA
jgi:hypothetical protein